MIQKISIVLSLIALFAFSAKAQLENIDTGTINGNVSILYQSYRVDSLIEAFPPPEKAGFNAYGNLVYTRGKFTAGMRYESYLPAVLGYSASNAFKGSGIGYRYLSYQADQLEVTVGNFYEQFGSGMLFRTFEERNIGYDSAMDGFRVRWSPFQGATIKGIYGKQRIAFDDGLVNGDGLVRGIDGELNLNDVISQLKDKKTKVTLGAGFVSKYQVDNNPSLILPENVGAYSGRVNLYHGGFNFFGEYTEKINDPSADNNQIYKKGRAVLVNSAWSKKGMGINVHAKVIDNMSFRSDRNASLVDGLINNIPAVTKAHTYNLAATLYPYGTIINGEASASVELFYKFAKKTPLGGKYGTYVSLNVAAANDISKTQLDPVTDTNLNGYETDLFDFTGGEKFIRDINWEVKKKINKKLKLAYTGFYFEFNATAQPVTTDAKGLIYTNIHVLEANYKIKPKHSLRVEAQTLFTKQDKQDWATLLVEYNVSPHWSFAVLDQYNYGNKNTADRVHYLYGTVTYVRNSNRIGLSYGRQRAGVFCVGGVCRVVPSSNGLTLTLTSTF